MCRLAGKGENYARTLRGVLTGDLSDTKGAINSASIAVCLVVIRRTVFGLRASEEGEESARLSRLGNGLTSREGLGVFTRVKNLT